MNQIKFIYFDVGNVLNEFEASFDGITSKFKIDPEKFMELWWENEDALTRGKMSPVEFWKKAVKRFRLKDGHNYDFMSSWTSGYSPQTRMHEIIKKIEGKRRFGLLTNHYIGMVEKSIEMGKIPDAKYEIIVTSHGTGYRKPEKEIYRIATEKTGVAPREILFIDDREDFIKGASDYGWLTIWFDMSNKDKAFEKIEKMLGLK